MKDMYVMPQMTIVEMEVQGPVMEETDYLQGWDLDWCQHGIGLNLPILNFIVWGAILAPQKEVVYGMLHLRSQN